LDKGFNGGEEEWGGAGAAGVAGRNRTAACLLFATSTPG